MFNLKSCAVVLCAVAMFAPFLRADAVVLPSGSTVAGKTLAEHSAGWWQYVFSVPEADNPLFDETGAKGGNQNGTVFFLMGKFDDGSGNPVVANRSVTVRDDQYLFFPLINYQVDNLFEDPPKTDQELKDAVKANIDGVTALHAKIDGTDVPDLLSHRETTDSFSYSIPENSIYGAFGIDLPAQTVSPVFADGYWLMIAPLEAGTHTVNFGGINGATNPAFNLDVTYQVNVQSGPTAIPLPAAIWPGIMLLTSLPVARKLRRR